MPSQIKIDRDQIAEFCRRHRIKRLSLFGSVLTNRFSDSSDIDVLVEFEGDLVVGYFTIGRLIVELSRMFGRPVDVRTPMELSQLFRDDVLAQAEVQYAAPRQGTERQSARRAEIKHDAFETKLNQTHAQQD